MDNCKFNNDLLEMAIVHFSIADREVALNCYWKMLNAANVVVSGFTPKSRKKIGGKLFLIEFYSNYIMLRICLIPIQGNC